MLEKALNENNCREKVIDWLLEDLLRESIQSKDFYEKNKSKIRRTIIRKYKSGYNMMDYAAEYVGLQDFYYGDKNKGD